jgi:hypothetical protein
MAVIARSIPTQSNVAAALRSFLLSVLPSGTDVILALPNRVPEPQSDNFVVMSPLRTDRLGTNFNTYLDSKFTAAIAGQTMTVTAVDPRMNGPIGIGSLVFGVGVTSLTTVTALGTGTGGIGTYTVSPSQTVSSRTMAAGAETIRQPTRETVQLDFHSKDQSAGGMATLVSALMRDEYATDQFAGQVPQYGVVPLLANDAKLMPFTNENQQIEWRWVMDVELQADQAVKVSMQFADQLVVGLIEVDGTFPP